MLLRMDGEPTRAGSEPRQLAPHGAVGVGVAVDVHVVGGGVGELVALGIDVVILASVGEMVVFHERFEIGQGVERELDAIDPVATNDLHQVMSIGSLHHKRRGMLLGDHSEPRCASRTFHAFGLRVIRAWTEDLGFGHTPPAVYARDDARAVLREAAKELGLLVAPEHPSADRRDAWAISISQLDHAVERYRLQNARDKIRSKSTGQSLFRLLIRSELAEARREKRIQPPT